MSLLSRIAVEAARGFGLFAKKGGVSATYLVVAGGGGGGGAFDGGGGGAGGYQTSTISLSILNTYSITVGAGGNGGYQTTASSGNNSVISGTGITTVTSTGGGGGGGGGGAVGLAGGSGGGGSRAFAGGTGTSGQGNNGGTGFSTVNAAGGGGGASAVGATATSGVGGNGGNGSSSSISGSSVTYAGGGGGSTTSGTTAGTGGTGGGGAASNSANGTAGTTNTGGGGGGTGGLTSTGGAGGSGIVIISYPSSTPLFVGGTITTSGGNQIHTFTSSGTLSPITPITASYLVVAGGGGGGQGGGGAGGLLTSSTTLYSGASYIVTVGAGGTAGTNQAAGSNGSDSVVSGTGLTTITSTGGGRGGYFSAVSGASGGSGGGGGGSDAGGGVGSGGAGTSGQGYAGGSGVSINTTNGGGGGGGAGAAGGNAVASSYGGQGGVGVQSSISGTATYYAGGGSGGCSLTTTGGNGGGGSGGAASSNGTAGTTNTGGGGGGGGNTTGGKLGGAGGSGIVIISYAGSQQFNGGLVTSSGGNTIHTFTSTGALTPLTNNLNNSLRFRSSASAYLNRTPTVAGSRTTWTWSAWVKLGNLSASDEAILQAGSSSQPYTLFGVFTANAYQLQWDEINTGSVVVARKFTTQVFRDPSAWYHIVFVWDTTQATASNRQRIYINGNQVTAFSSSTDPALNAQSQFNSNVATRIASTIAGGSYFDGYMTDINFIDGQALEPYYFGNNDANGVWKPIQYKGTYGTNGFYLTFGNTTSTTTLGYDSSPNGNNWTCNNISLTAGTTYDAMLDVPTNTSATVANYAVMNAAAPYGSFLTLSQANLKSTCNGAYWAASPATFGVSSGKWYWEVQITNLVGNSMLGITKDTDTGATTGQNVYPGISANSYGYIAGGLKYNNATGTSYGATYTTNDIIGIALDMDAGTLTYYKNNTSQGTAFSGLSGTYLPSIGVNDTNTAVTVNFGQRPFTYTPPTGYVALNTYNLPTPTILQGNKYMDATLYTGNGSTQVVVNNAQFKPDLVWLKGRSIAYSHYLFDSVRGSLLYLTSNSTGAETSYANSLTSFNSNGFSLGSAGGVNESPNTMVGWQWQAGQGSTSSNTSGSITSTVSVNTTAGFSICTFNAGASGAQSFGHGLGVAPKMVIIKDRANAVGWNVYHSSVITATNQFLQLNSTNGISTVAGVWGSALPTSTLVGIGSGTIITANANGVAYCWAEIAGFSKFGSYTGNGSADGPFVYLGFRPKWIMIKITSGAVDDWIIFDTSRNTYNLMNLSLFPDTSGAEFTSTTAVVDYLSNGFKIRGTNGIMNGNTYSYIYAAFAENPFKNSNAR